MLVVDLSALQSLPLVSLPAGEVLIAQGTPIPAVYFLETGEVTVVKDAVAIAEIYEPGAVLGEMSWLLGTPPTATIRTRTEATFRAAADPAAFLRAHPDVTLHMATILARRIDSLTRYVVDIRHQFRDRADHLGIMDEVLDALIHKHPRHIVRRDVGD